MIAIFASTVAQIVVWAKFQGRSSSPGWLTTETSRSMEAAQTLSWYELRILTIQRKERRNRGGPRTIHL